MHWCMNVWVKQGHRNWAEGYILGRAETPRSFYVKCEDGRVMRRNQPFFRMRKLPSASSSRDNDSVSAGLQNTGPQINEIQTHEIFVPNMQVGQTQGPGTC